MMTNVQLKTKLFSLLGLSLIAISACTAEDMADTSFDDRYKFVFEDSTNAKIAYYCDPGKGEEDAQRRAQQAHAYSERSINGLAQDAAEKKLAGELTEEQWANAIQNGAARISEDVEKKFGCLVLPLDT